MKQELLQKWLILSLLVGLLCSAVWGAVSFYQQQHLADQLIRLHVIAASDSERDQELKLMVRDAVLEETSLWLQGASTRQTAEEVLKNRLTEIDAIAERVLAKENCGAPVHTTLSEETYPTRDYGTFALPGGEYLSLRVIIDEGRGHNWWCVVFPPLCTALVSEEVTEKAAQAGFGEEEIGLMTKSSKEYEFRFKSIELWKAWQVKWNQKTKDGV